uniref:Membrane-bound lytic murein transglycosylase B n=1 Tax=Candidatus Kentrum sp. SD TaxID=2126332 RepID=A0A451BQU0_9GAMM|nr:MAG: membrane-bound lytic murein transglycosylase B [Candidatus Kentron sp. SD]VFK48051.1 MAG: membrane-bound lytic murein transglycosylase B [Candidatus Kentron sp. SD]VFK80644.1 MAG: membrane-bound lytic murein transglycosylase B [Candidatus Kentron sp. SD]
MTPRLSIVMAILFTASLLLSTPSFAGEEKTELLQKPEVRQFIHRMATKHGYPREELVALMGKVRIVDALLKPSKPAEALPWYKYRRIFLTVPRIRAGVRFWRTHQDTLERAEALHGVPPEIIVAILGVESYFGLRKGKYPVLNSLATLGFYGSKRKSFFLKELEHFLLLTREEKGLDIHGLKGSYAGAMGLPQFISSSYRHYAVDFDGDGRRDLIENTSDAIGSAANFLARHGWRRDRGIAIPVKSVEHAKIRALLKKGVKPHIAFSALKDHGVTIDEAILLDEPVSLIKLKTETGPEYWVGRKNFYTITLYNHSKLYAMAIYQLAEAIRERYQEE